MVELELRCVFIDSWSSLALIFLVFQEIWHKSLEGISPHLYGKLCIFGVMTYFVAEKEFFYYAFSYSIECNS